MDDSGILYLEKTGRVVIPEKKGKKGISADDANRELGKLLGS